MKITYEFVTGDKVEIEVSDEWGKVLVEMNREDYNEEKKETRRHYKLDAEKEGSRCLMDEDASVENLVISNAAAKEILKKMRKCLTSKQLEAFLSVCVSGMNEQEYANEIGISRPVVHRRIAAAKKNLKNYFKMGTI